MIFINKLKFIIVKRYKIYNLIIIGIIILFTSCEKDVDDTKDLSSITYYPEFTVTGDAEIIHSLGTPFVDPGVTAEEDGKALDVTTKVIGEMKGYSGTTVNTDVADKYSITYSAQNSDGFFGSASRTVYVAKTGDLVNSIEGIYTSYIERNGEVGNPQYTDLQYVLIWKNTDGTYGLSDGIGGYYALGRGYGPNYRAGGCTITANNIATNDFTCTQFGVGAFGGVCTITSMTVDPGTKTINFTSSWDAGYVFVVTLTQVQF